MTNFIKSLVISGLLISGLQAFPCDNAYIAQKANLLVLQGKDRNSLKVIENKEYNSVNSALGDLNSIKGSTGEYTKDTVVLEFESTCNAYLPHPAKLAIRNPSTSQFEVKEMSMWTRFYSEVNIGDPAVLYKNIYLIKNDTNSAFRDMMTTTSKGVVQGTYGTYIRIDTIKDVNGTNKGVASATLAVESVSDSSHFYKLHNGGLTAALTTPQTVRQLTVQFLTVTYDTTPPTPIVHQTKALASRINISYLNDRVQIKVPVQSMGKVETLSLFTLMGKKIKEIHSTNNTFEWDGTSEWGQNMPRGVYLMEADGNVFGKIVYSRSSH